MDELLDISGIGLGDPNITIGAKETTLTPEQEATKAQEEAVKQELIKQEAESKKKEAEKIESDRLAKEEVDKKAKEIVNEVEIEGIKYKLDNKGNALDSKGFIHKTKEQIDSMVSVEDEELPLVEEFIQKTGYEILDDKGQPKKFDDTIEGIIEAAKEVGKIEARKLYDNLIEQDPEFQEFIDYKKRGGSLKGFAEKKTDSWRSVKLDDNNELQLMDVVVADLVASGQDEEQAKLTAEMYKDTKRLKDFGKKAYQRLTSNEDIQEKEEQEEFVKQQQQQQENIKQHWDNVNEVIKKGSLKNIIIPEADKDSFFNYIAKKADDKGHSQATLDRGKLPIEQLLQLDYLQFKGFDLSKLIQTAVKTEKARSLRLRVERGGNSGTGGGEGINTNAYGKPNSNLDGISLDSIL